MGKCDERAEPGKNLNVVQAFVVHLYVGTAELELGYDMHTRHRAHFVGASCGPVSGHIIRNRTAVRSDVEGKAILGNLLRRSRGDSKHSCCYHHHDAADRELLAKHSFDLLILSHCRLSVSWVS